MAPLVSIVTTCFNASATIGETLRSVDALTALQPVRIEHVVVDGASTDSTMDIVRRHPSPIREAVSERDSGIYEGMNRGLARARGDYVWFVNADDLVHPRLLEAWGEFVQVLEERPAIVVGELEMFRVVGGATRTTRYWSVPGRVGVARRFGWHPPHPAFVARRALLRDIGGFDQSKRVAGDYKLMTALLGTVGDDVALFPRPLVAMREGGASNGSWQAIVRANRECYASLRELGESSCSAALSIGLKLLRKVGQRVAPAPRAIR